MVQVRGLRVLGATTALFGLLVLFGCVSSEGVALPSGELQDSEVVECFPVKAAILQDQSGSVSWTRTPQFTAEQLTPIVNLLRQCGGELAVGLIRDNSNRSLVRLLIVPEPAGQPELPTETNPFRAAALKKEYEQQFAEYQKAAAAWRTSTDGEVAAFSQAVKTLLEQPSDANSTDIWGAVRRANSFLSEDDAVWGGETHRWALFVTDGLQTARTSPSPVLPEGTHVVVVNASDTVGVLDHFKPFRFESVDAAVRFLVATETGR